MPSSRPLYALLPILALFPLGGCGNDDSADPPPMSPGESETVKSSASIMLHGEFTANPGASLEVEQSLSLKDGDLLQTRGENEVTGSVAMEQSEKQVIHILENGGREIEIGDGGTRLSVRVEEDEPLEETTVNPLSGKTVNAIPKEIPGAETTWTYALKDDADAKLPAGFGALDLRADALYPKQWLKFGDSWQPEPEALAALLGPGFQLREGTIKMKLLGFENRRGDRCAEIGADIVAEGLFQAAGSRQDLKLRLKGKIYRSLHVYQDLETTLSGSIELHSKLGEDEVNIKGPVTFSRLATWKD